MVVGEEVGDSLAARQMTIDDFLSLKIVDLFKELVTQSFFLEDFYFVY